MVIGFLIISLFSCCI